MALTALAAQGRRRHAAAAHADPAGRDVRRRRCSSATASSRRPITVMGAVEGLEVVHAGAASRYVVPFAIGGDPRPACSSAQRFGTGARSARLFGPILVVWFGLLAVVGLHAHRLRGAARSSYALNPVNGRSGSWSTAAGGVLAAARRDRARAHRRRGAVRRHGPLSGARRRSASRGLGDGAAGAGAQLSWGRARC